MDGRHRRPLRTRRAAGAEILQRPETQFYGDRTYRARDPEGHIWTFGQTVQDHDARGMGQGRRPPHPDDVIARMTPAAFLKLALSLPEAAERSHFGHGDLRVRGKIFATPADREDGEAVLKLTPDQQQMLCEAEPDYLRARPWRLGPQGLDAPGSLPKADAATARSALWMAWRNVAPQDAAEGAPRRLHERPRKPHKPDVDALLAALADPSSPARRGTAGQGPAPRRRTRRLLGLPAPAMSRHLQGAASQRPCR